MKSIKQHQKILPSKEEENIQQNSSNEWSSVSHLIEKQEATNPLNWSLVKQEKNQLVQKWNQDSLEDKIENALSAIGMDEHFIAAKLDSIMKEAFTATPKGDIIPDYKTMLEAIKVWYKFKKRGPDTVVALPMIFWNQSGQL